MQCDRCHGFMVPHHVHDLLDTTSTDHVQTWRCVSCGEVVDPVIMENRRKQRQHAAAADGVKALVHRSAA